MIDPSLIRTFADAGGLVLFIALCLLAALAFIKGWIVPGFVYRREVTRGDRATEQLERNTDVLEANTAAITRLAARRRDA